MKYYDKEEEELIESIEAAFDRGELVPEPNSAQIIQQLQKAAVLHNAKKKISSIPPSSERSPLSSLQITLRTEQMETIEQEAKKRGFSLSEFVVFLLSTQAEKLKNA